MSDVQSGLDDFVDLLRCPETGDPLHREGNALLGSSGVTRYRLDEHGVPLFAESHRSPAVEAQRRHYDRVARLYVTNLGYPHTREYMAYLDREFLAVVGGGSLGTTAEICCGQGEAFDLLGDRVARGVGVDISIAMIHEAIRRHRETDRLFVQGDATSLPLADRAFDTVVMLGGIHHVCDRLGLFREIRRVLKPGGRFLFREPVSDLALWRLLRAVVYRLSPALDHETESPLRRADTWTALRACGLVPEHWSTHGLLGFCLFMNSDVLVVNRLFRFVPGIEKIVRAATATDEALLRFGPLRYAGLIAVGAASRP